jgi:hypothetical protein
MNIFLNFQDGFFTVYCTCISQEYRGKLLKQKTLRPDLWLVKYGIRPLLIPKNKFDFTFFAPDFSVENPDPIGFGYRS